MGDTIRDALPTYEAPDAPRAWARAQASSAALATPRVRNVNNLRRFAYAAGLVVAAATGWMGNRYFDARSENANAQ
jgi:hypothetical protein